MSQEERAVINGNSLAFPAIQHNDSGTIYKEYPGMTKRELMATIIMAGSASALNERSTNYIESRRDMATIAVHVTNDLLLALEQVV